MVAFAVGGLLGDTIFHLLPEIFLGEDSPEHARFVLVEPNRNLLLGVAILVGFVAFVALDKGLRIATGAGHEHGHGSGHEVPAASQERDVVGQTTGAQSGKDAGEVTSRKKLPKEVQPDGENKPRPDPNPVNPSVKLGGYLNLIADFTHNITDGLALSSSFYASPTLGATTTVAVFFHEIPHEVGDFALLIQSGFSSRAAMGAQFLTAVGAFLGTLIGIAIQEAGSTSSGAGTAAHDRRSMRTSGLGGTSLAWGDMLLPFTAGTFLYVGTVAVIPELLEAGGGGGEKGGSKWGQVRKTLMQFLAMAAGAGIMLV
ncbi:MAG: hypothetical protein M1826_006643 [Phylliscum demangeonii]|nr:MAG: hypothetical protein M1826_006643 [Phylliscum demangeonii]